MDKTIRRLMEIAGHLDAITEEMREDRPDHIQAGLIKLYAIEIKLLVEEMKGLLNFYIFQN